MVKKFGSDKGIDYWLGRGAYGMAEILTMQSKSGVSVMNKLLKHFSGMSRSIAGAIFSSAHKSLTAGNELRQGNESAIHAEDAGSLDPNLFPEGRMGRRYRYRVILDYTFKGDKEKIVRTAFVTSPQPISWAMIKVAALGQAHKLITISPTGHGRDIDPKSYKAVATLRSIWRSH